jgi:hypothetical protein
LRNNRGSNNNNWKGGITINLHFCKKCGKKISLSSYYGNKLCKICGNNSQKGIPNLKKANFGIKNGMWGKVARHSKGQYYKNVYMRSSYEIRFAKCCDKNNIKWLYEPKVFDLYEFTYTPDFYLPERDLYIEVKGYWREDAIIKFDLFKKLCKSKNIQVIDKKLLSDLEKNWREIGQGNRNMRLISREELE